MEENKVKEQKDFDILNKMKNLPVDWLLSRWLLR